MALTLVTPPAVEPVSLSDAKAQVRKTGTDEDTLFTTFIIPAARQRGELATRRQWNTATWRLVLDAWPCEGWIDVPLPPLRQIVSIKYLDTAGVQQTLAASQYVVEAPAGPRAMRGKVSPAYGVTWPTALDRAGAIEIEFTAGYGDTAADVPAILRHAVLRDVGALYEHREDVVAGVTAAELPRSSSSVYRGFKSRPRQRGVA